MTFPEGPNFVESIKAMRQAQDAKAEATEAAARKKQVELRETELVLNSKADYLIGLAQSWAPKIVLARIAPNLTIYDHVEPVKFLRPVQVAIGPVRCWNLRDDYVSRGVGGSDADPVPSVPGVALGTDGTLYGYLNNHHCTRCKGTIDVKVRTSTLDSQDAFRQPLTGPGSYGNDASFVAEARIQNSQRNAGVVEAGLMTFLAGHRQIDVDG